MKKLFLLIGLFCFLAMGANAYAVSIGLDTDGTDTDYGFTEIDRIVWNTDTGLSIDYQPFGFLIDPFVPYDTTFKLQGYASTLVLNGQTQGNNGVQFLTDQLTFTASFTETVVSQVLNDVDSVAAEFSYGEDLNSTFDLYMDTALNADPLGATGYADDATATKILSAHLKSLSSSFTATDPGNLGTGSFDARVAIDSYDSDYIDLYGVDEIFFRILSTGTLNEPPDFNPDQMWDGTDTDTGIMLKFTGESTFAVVPEPTSMLLLGTGLLGFVGALRRRNRKL